MAQVLYQSIKMRAFHALSPSISVPNNSWKEKLGKNEKRHLTRAFEGKAESRWSSSKAASFTSENW